MEKVNERQRIINTFENHIIRDHQVIYRTDTPRVEVMTFGNKNGSSNCRIDYMLRDGSLAVYGDLGEAIYRWGGELSMEWIAGLDLDYFHGKCQASGEGDGPNKGARPEDWDPAIAEEYIRNHIREYRKGDSIPVDYYKTTEGAREELRDLLDASQSSQDEFLEYIHSASPGLALNDDDWWEWLPSVGNVTPTRIRMHLIGLKMAFGKDVGRYC